jgi:hypothetical protein
MEKVWEEGHSAGTATVRTTKGVGDDPYESSGPNHPVGSEALAIRFR